MRKTFFLFLGLISMATFAFSENIKEPNVSGQFYPSDPKQLGTMVEDFLSRAPAHSTDKKVEVIIAPHAGYIYSGGVAGHSFKAASGRNFKTIVVIGPSHFYGFDGVSIWTDGGFKTPLGTITVDKDFTQRLAAYNEKFYFEPRAFEREHSLEVELPFLQKTFQNFKIVPIVMGQPRFETCEALAQALRELIGSREDVLLVISTDLSHYHDDAFARAMDQRTLETVQQLDAKTLWQNCHSGTMEMCGCVPVVTSLLYANRKGLKDVEILKYANSGDVTGDTDNVVGYSSVVMYGNTVSPLPQRQESQLRRARGAVEAAQEIPPLNLEQKRKLVKLARATIEEYIRHKSLKEVTETDPRLQEREGAFVTLHRQGQLRGCIGHVIGQRPLYLTVREVAIAAATDDPRFPSVQVEELNEIDVEVSVLSRPRTIATADEIVLGRHGVMISQGKQHGLFLPQVATETGWSKEEFLSQLCLQKAGLPVDCWKDPKTKIEIFTADVFSEKDVR